MSRQVIETAAGPAWIDLDLLSSDSAKLVVLGHGAGGGIDAPDLLAVKDACLARGVSVARVTQPYRVVGRRAPPTAQSLDAAWREIVAGFDVDREWQLIFGGRSSGARVACRAAVDDNVLPRPFGVVALAFPVHPPGKPEKSRLAELDAVKVPVLVVQGASDPFGMPGRKRNRTVRTVAGDHSLRKSAPEVGLIVADWIAKLS